MDETMGNPQATLTTVDLAWLGGLIDGEGCVYLARRLRGKAHGDVRGNERVNMKPGLLISNSDPAIIEEIHRILDLAKIGHWVTWRKPERDRRSKRMMGAVSIFGLLRTRKAIEVLAPYLRGKHEEAEVLHEWIERRLTIKPTSHNTYDAVDDEYYERMARLKDKGASETIRGGRHGSLKDGDVNCQEIVRTAAKVVEVVEIATHPA